MSNYFNLLFRFTGLASSLKGKLTAGAVIFAGYVAFLMANKQCQSSEGSYSVSNLKELTYHKCCIISIKFKCQTLQLCCMEYLFCGED